METRAEPLISLFFQKVTNAIDKGIIILAPDRNVIAWNQWVEERSGFKQEEVIGKNLYSVFSNITNTRFKTAIDEAINKGRASLLSQSIHKSPLPLYSIFTHDASQRINQTIDIQAINISSETKSYCLIQIGSVDTVVKREETLREKTIELSQAVDDSRDNGIVAQGIADISEDSVITFSIDGEIESFNPCAEAMFGYQAKELLGTSGRHRLLPELDEQWESLTNDLIRKSKLTSNKSNFNSGWQYLQGKHKTGRVFPVYLKLSILMLVDRLLIVGIVRDLTELESSKQALSESKHALEIAMETGRLSMWDWDITSNKIKNDNLLKLLGYSAEETNIDWEGLIHPDDFDSINTAVEDYLSGVSHELNVEYRALSASGEWLWMYDTCKVVKSNKEGWPLRIIGINQLIHQRKMAELEATDISDKLIGAARVKTEFLSNMSHELRTPMNGVMGILSLLETTMKTEEQKEYISVGKSSANSLLRLIDNVLDVTKLGEQSVKLELITFHPEDILKEIVKLLSETAGDKVLTIEYKLDESVGDHDKFILTTDPLRLRQILTNLVGNAIKFTEQGKVQISVFKLENSSFLFEVEDSGIGIPEDRQEMIFDAFTQADLSTTRRFGGTGLGLGICKQLVELLGGAISVTSTEGEGSLFSFTVIDHSKQSLRIQHIESESV